MRGYEIVGSVNSITAKKEACVEKADSTQYISMHPLESL